MKPFEANPPFTNALLGAPSLYLRQHQHNPVMWYPWSEHARNLAREKNLPILLSIGYSSCYWCHVMEREVFENPSIAAFMNQHFINIKMDREEHPDIDEIYMVARQLMTQEGGWPNNVFLTSDLKPFFAGGTFMAADAGNRPSFPRVLEWLRAMWVERQDEVQKTADETYALMQRFLAPSPPRGTNSLSPWERARVRASSETVPVTAPHPTSPLMGEEFYLVLTEELLANYDESGGGFGRQPKFPHETYLEFLIFAGHTLQHKPALDTAADALLAMASGGIYDQVGCGFHRYAVDRHWYVPHFEKMLYNQAMCARVYTRMFTLTNNGFFADVAQGTLEFVSGPLGSEQGGFYTAIDAETDGVEGAYYAWSADELQAALSEEELTLFQHFFALADIPHFPGHKPVHGQVIVARKSLWAAAKEAEAPYVEVSATVGQVMNKLLALRNKRQAPLLDDKIITGWNGLMIAAYAEAAVAFKQEKFLHIAERAAHFIWQHMHTQGEGLRRIHARGKSYLPAQLEDYAYYIEGLLALHQANAEAGWLDKAETLMQAADNLFLDAQTGGYRLNRTEDAAMISMQHASDSVLPSPAATMLGNLITAYEITGNEQYLQRAQQCAAALVAHIKVHALPEYATLLKHMLRLSPDQTAAVSKLEKRPVVKLNATFASAQMPESGAEVSLVVTCHIAKGWYLHPHHASQAQATTLDISGVDVADILSIEYPQAEKRTLGKHTVIGYFGDQNIGVKIKLAAYDARKPITCTLTFQPCTAGQCLPVMHAECQI